MIKNVHFNVDIYKTLLIFRLKWSRYLDLLGT